MVSKFVLFVAPLGIVAVEFGVLCLNKTTRDLSRQRVGGVFRQTPAQLVLLHAALLGAVQTH